MIKFGYKINLDLRKINNLVSKDMILIGFKKGKKHTPSKLDLSTLAEWLHFGTANIPARPFIKEGLKTGQKAVDKAISEKFKKDMTLKKGGNDKIGKTAVKQIQKFVKGSYYASKTPNAPSTIKKKGFNKPLIETKEMINSLTYEIREKKLWKNKKNTWYEYRRSK